ncbi:MAG: hypothetical protein E4G89_06390 [Methanothrix sp.]|nr:MAG: hypothetical protein E4G89_06390 [Methanothrix sp.]
MRPSLTLIFRASLAVPLVCVATPADLLWAIDPHDLTCRKAEGWRRWAPGKSVFSKGSREANATCRGAAEYKLLRRDRANAR